MRYFGKIIPRLLFLAFLTFAIWMSNATSSENVLKAPLDREISLNLKDIPLRAILKEIEQATDIKFGFHDALIDSAGKATLVIRRKTLKDALEILLLGSNIGYKADTLGYITLFKTAKPKKGSALIKGRVIDGLNGVVIADAIITAESKTQESYEAKSTAEGQFYLHVKEGSYKISVNGMELIHQIIISDGQKIHLPISIETATLPAVSVIASVDSVFSASEIESGFHSLKLSEHQAAPAVGSPETFQGLQGFAGVGIFNDYSNKLFIRGSPPGQILFLLDGVPVEIPYHLFGIASIFNPQMVEEVNLSSGVYSARYGDRVGGVLDIRTRNFNKDGFKRYVNLNPAITSSLIIGNIDSKTSLLISNRLSHHDIASRVFVGESTPYRFYDFYGKVSYQPNSTNRFSLNGFYSRDSFQLNEQAFTSNREDFQDYLQQIPPFQFAWDNLFISANWLHNISNDNHFMLSYSAASYSINDLIKNTDSDFALTSYDSASGLIDFSNILTNNQIFKETLNGDLTINPHRNHRVQLGLQMDRYKLRYKWAGLTDFLIDEFSQVNIPWKIFFEVPANTLNYSNNISQLSGYIEDCWQIHDKVSLRAGLRFEKSSFASDLTIDPRLNLGFKINKNVEIKAGYGRIHQSLTSALDDTLLYMLPLLFPVENNLLQWADHYTLGLKTQTSNWHFFAEGYYKSLYNQSTFFFGAADPELREGWTKSILSRSKELFARWSQGEINDYGLEFGLEKYGRRLDLSLNYTLSYSRQDLPSAAKIHSKFSPIDQRHVLKAAGNYKLGQSWNLNMRWLLTSGRPKVFYSNNEVLFDDSAINTDCTPESPCRYPTYHRLDLSVMKRFNFSKWAITPYIQIPDVYGSKRLEDFLYYELDWQEGSQASKHNLFSIMPIVPTFGFNIEL